MVSAHPRGAISVIGQSRKPGQKSTFNRTACITSLRDRNQRPLSDENDRTPVLLPPQPQATKGQEKRKLLHTNIPITQLYLRPWATATWMSLSWELRTQVKFSARVYLRNCSTPQGTLFRDDAFRTACGNLRDKNEARIIQDIGRLLVPSPETLAALGAEDLRVLNESVNEGWNNSIPVTSPRPQPDFSVGFRRSVFSDDQLSKLQPLLGDPSYLSYFRATYYMYFPVLTCEAKCGTAGLDIADRQNAHSMTLAVRGIVQLFKLARKEDTLHRELLTFSVSHDHRTVRLYGYYPIIDGPKTKIYRHPIHTFDITALGGEERWTTYKFTVGVYNYLLTLLGKIRSIIDELPPDFSLKLAQSSEQQFSEAQLSEPSGQSQQLGDQNLAEVPISQPNHVDLQQITPDPSMQAEKPATKKKKKGKGKG